MDVIAEKGECHSLWLREICRSELAADQVDRARKVLLGNGYVHRGIRKIICGALVLLRIHHELQVECYKKLDELEQEMEAPIGSSTKHVNVRSEIVAVLAGLNMSQIAQKLHLQAREELQEDERDAACKTPERSNTEPASAETDAIAEVTAATASLNLQATSVSSWTPPPIYDRNGRLNQKYITLLKKVGISHWLVQRHSERPITLYSGDDAPTTDKKLRSADDSLARWLLKFVVIRHQKTPITWKLDALISGSCFNEADFKFSRSQLVFPFNTWSAGAGTIGVFVKMNHPNLGSNASG